MQVRKFMVGALVSGMVLFVPGVALANNNGGLLGGGNLLGGNSGLIGSGCKEDEIVSVGGDAGLVGVNLGGDLDTQYGVLGLTGHGEDDLLTVGGDAGLVGLNLKHLDTDSGLLGLSLSSCDR